MISLHGQDSAVDVTGLCSSTEIEGQCIVMTVEAGTGEISWGYRW
jgi:hypothetical protein